jgi:RimJ/RimL family protein N-acetyltransferase
MARHGAGHPYPPEMRLSVPDPPLAADGIVLRRPDADDTEWMTKACNDPDIARFIPGMPSPYTEADAERFFERANHGWTSGTRTPFVITDETLNEPLGFVTMNVDERDPAIGLVGYWVRPEARGRGAAKTAVHLITRWAFNDLAMERLQLTTAPENVASQRVAEYAGFRREGVLRNWVATADGRRDSLMFSLLPADLADAN